MPPIPANPEVPSPAHNASPGTGSSHSLHVCLHMLHPTQHQTKHDEIETKVQLQDMLVCNPSLKFHVTSEPLMLFKNLSGFKMSLFV